MGSSNWEEHGHATLQRAGALSARRSPYANCLALGPPPPNLNLIPDHGFTVSHLNQLLSGFPGLVLASDGSATSIRGARILLSGFVIHADPSPDAEVQTLGAGSSAYDAEVGAIAMAASHWARQCPPPDAILATDSQSALRRLKARRNLSAAELATRQAL